MKKRAILREVADLRAAVTEAHAKLDQAGLADLAGKLTWLHERVDLLFARCEAMRGDVTLDAAAAKRLTYAVGQFSARLDRLEAPRPRGRPRKPKPEPPNGASEETEDPKQESQSHDAPIRT